MHCVELRSEIGAHTAIARRRYLGATLGVRSSLSY